MADIGSRRGSSSSRTLLPPNIGVSMVHLPEALDGASPPLRLNVINPYGRPYRYWQMFLIVLVAYSAWASPFELALEKSASPAHLVVDLGVDVFFCADIVVSFFVAYRDRSTDLLVDDRSKIAVRYLTRPSFVLDVASTVPLQIVYQLVRGKRDGPCGFLILLRLWRLRRASKLFARLTKKEGGSQASISSPIAFSYGFYQRYNPLQILIWNSSVVSRRKSTGPQYGAKLQ